MIVVGLVLDPASNAPIVLLKDASGELCVPIWIGVPEATSIATAIKNVPLLRPMTHDLLNNVIGQVGGQIKRITIHKIEDNTFFANIDMAVGDVCHSIDARPSDSLALAIRAQAPIYVATEVVEAAKVHVIPEDEESDENLPGAEEGSPDEPGMKESDFKTIDKDKWEELLADMDVDDFKYKM
jgi:bifunctional DNase/RNase